jgi:anti-sigma factor RsiW
MKPCADNRKQLAWLAAGALDAPRARSLRLHLESCEACRQYFAEVSRVAATLTMAEPGAEADIEATESFHRKVLATLRAVEPESSLEAAVRTAAGWLLNWRRTLPAAGLAAVVIAALLVLARPHQIAPPAPTPPVAEAAQTVLTDPVPTVANYQMLASHSLEMLDDLLTRQGVGTGAPAPVYSASMSMPRRAAD